MELETQIKFGQEVEAVELVKQVQLMELACPVSTTAAQVVTEDLVQLQVLLSQELVEVVDVVMTITILAQEYLAVQVEVAQAVMVVVLIQLVLLRQVVGAVEEEII